LKGTPGIDKVVTKANNKQPGFSEGGDRCLWEQRPE